MSEKRIYTIYLDSWMINAGIVGFLNILLTKKEKDMLIKSRDSDEIQLRENRIKISHNKIEFENNVLADNEKFSKLFFQEAFNRYGRYNRFITRLYDIKELIGDCLNSTDDEEKLKIKKLIKQNWDNKGSYSLLEKKYEAYYKTKLNLKRNTDDEQVILALIDQCLFVLNKEDNYQDFFENDVQYYLSSYFADDKTGIKKQSGFLNVSVQGSKEKHFYTRIVEPIINNSVEFDKKYKCVFDYTAAKKKSSYNSGLIPFFGHPGNENFFWLDTPNMIPMSELYELLYWCTFAGFTDITKGNEIRLLFCNQDSSIVDLYNANYKLSIEFNKDVDKSISYTNFLLNLILSEKMKSTYEQQNTVLIDIDNKKEKYVKIHSLYISRKKAEFIKHDKNFDKLNHLSKFHYTDKDVWKSVGLAILERILHNNVNYSFLYYLTKLSTSGNNESKFIKGDILQEVNYLINNYNRSFHYRSEYMKNEELYAIYQHGQQVARTIKARNDENKIRGFVHKFLNYQKTGNTNAFMNLFMRIHMAYGLMTQESVIKCIENETNFNAYGYSFINGLLNIVNQENKTGGSEK